MDGKPPGEGFFQLRIRIEPVSDKTAVVRPDDRPVSGIDIGPDDLGHGGHFLEKVFENLLEVRSRRPEIGGRLLVFEKGLDELHRQDGVALNHLSDKRRERRTAEKTVIAEIDRRLKTENQRRRLNGFSSGGMVET